MPDTEPELPGIPMRPKPPWWKRPQRLVSKPKLPAWPVLLWLLIQQIPDWKGRIDFWLDAAKTAGGYTAVAAAVIGSPYFSLGMAGAAVLWLAFAGEPRRGVIRHPWLPYLGWTIAGFFFTAIIVTAGWGAIQLYVNRQVSAKTAQQFWYLTDDQKKSLGRELDKTPPSQRFVVNVRIVFGNAQVLTIANDLAEVFQAHGWTFSGTEDMSLRADLLGINFITADDRGRTDQDQPPHAMELWKILRSSGINTYFAYDPKFADNSLELAIGSRPPYW